MKLIIRNNKIIATATDEYDGTEETIQAPENYDASIDYDVINGELVIPIPQVLTMRQARLILLKTGILESIETAIAASEDKELQIEWEYADEIKRGWDSLNNLATAMGITQEQVDDLFIQGALL